MKKLSQMKTVHNLVNSKIKRDSLFLFEEVNTIFGRIKSIKFSDIIEIVLFHHQKGNEKVFHLKAANPENMKCLKRGDVIAFKCPENGYIEQIILLNSSRKMPSENQWTKEEWQNHRELDIIMRKNVMNDMIKRSNIIFRIREYMHSHKFCEVELPILKKYPDIAPTLPFEILNASENLFLRTTFPPFERLLVGFDNVFTIGPNFRNGDFSLKNLPEFQMFCMAIAGKDYLCAAKFIHKMFADIAASLFGSTIVTISGKKYDLSCWEYVSLSDAFQDILGVNMNDLDIDNNLYELCYKEKVKIPEIKVGIKGHFVKSIMFDALFEQKIVDKFNSPVFFTGTPWYLAGPAEQVRDNSFLKLRGEGYIGGMEIMNAKCVLTNIEATDNWHRSVIEDKKYIGLDKYSELDLDFMESISYGLVPGALVSFGIDRFVMWLLQKENIQDVTLYPLNLKKQE